MGETRPEDARERPRFFTLGMIAVLSLLVVVVLLFLLRLALVFSARKAIERELAEARASGYPTTLEEIAPPPVPEEENSAPLLETAGAMVTRHREYGLWFDEFDRRTPSDEMRTALGKHAAALKMAREALKRAQYRFERSYDSTAADFTHPNLVDNKTIVNLMLADSLVKAREGKGQESLDAFFDALELGRRIGTDPPLISKMIALALVACAPIAVERMEREGLLDDDMRRAIIERLGRGDILPSADTLFVGELAFISTSYEDFFGERRLWPGSYSQPVYARAVVRVFQFVYLDDMAQMVRSLRETAEACRLHLRPWELLREVKAVRARIDARPEWRRPLSRLYSWAPAAVSLLDTQSFLDSARAGLALELYRSANGEYPDHLNALVPEFLAEVPKDPFTGKELGYIRSGDDLTVYSVRMDLKYTPDDDLAAWKTKRPPPPPPRPSRRRRGRKRKSEAEE